ncbi:23S rRNA/U6 snRNA (adenine-N(6))-methyltransferase Mtl16 [Schizosaccharomyces osmophilus]|uniref:23S rRNA/U6 snRNA (Adenine-N(6))-methyltransferase Mtl16 n=1 Tax=Schizosaccharomyces osmophilus TaxID=2545709 RepID=A0AAF0AWU2_9SCHI|nr:23S rRNA/U6 snRNA (adenine-N(6))-methyltransferase Mtl16 [Schizosaccharomyces osmophilus]WBW73249.1 23S rRNA/U6 snRNA (adenine-N(6))-methyltransferase Mtl16 [Schizosaccharomyces osmophilus]
MSTALTAASKLDSILHLDFQKLSQEYPPLQHFLQEGHIDFWDQGAVLTLAKAILKVYFSLELSLPKNRLCPMVPNRVLYLDYIESLLQSTIVDFDNEKVIGLDIGTGASCIYPLLGCKLYSFNFLATEIDSSSYDAACSNVMNNRLEDKIKLEHRCEAASFLSRYPSGQEFTFVICNPPFYGSNEEIFNNKDRLPNSICSGSKNEMITQGGEVEFARRILQESKCRREILWFTCLLGKKSSLADLIHDLRDEKIDNYGIYEIHVGKTKRWILSWSFSRRRPLNHLIRPAFFSLPKLLPRKTLYEWDVSINNQTFFEVLDGFLDSMNVEHSRYHEKVAIFSNGISWSRKARRTGKHQNPSQISMEDSFRCTISYDNFKGQCCWKEGKDYLVYESFCSTLHRKYKESSSS